MDICFASKKSTLEIKFRQTSGANITGRIQWRPKVVLNPDKAAEQCPLPNPFILPEQEFSCTKM